MPEYQNPEGDWQDLSQDEKLIRQLYEFDATSDDMSQDYPSHLHIDLLPRAQGQGQGKQLMKVFLDKLRAMGSQGVHLGLGIKNKKAYAFYKHIGFEELERSEGAIFMAMKFR